MRQILINLSTLLLLTSLISCSRNKNARIQSELMSASESNIATSTLVDGWYYISENETDFQRQLDKSNESYFINPKPIVIRKYFDKVELFNTGNSENDTETSYGISIQIHWKYKDLWSDATAISQGNRLGLIIDNKLVNAPMVNARIDNGMSSLNRNVYSKNELEDFVRILNGRNN